MNKSTSDSPSVPEYRRFGEVLRDLLIERAITTKVGNPNWTAIAGELQSVSYESLRKAVTGDRVASPRIVSAVAQVLDVPAETFVEYRLFLLRESLDPSVTSLSTAVETLRAWEGT